MNMQLDFWKICDDRWQLLSFIRYFSYINNFKTTIIRT